MGKKWEFLVSDRRLLRTPKIAAAVATRAKGIRKKRFGSNCGISAVDRDAATGPRASGNAPLDFL
jgi:hypothetical protein